MDAKGYSLNLYLVVYEHYWMRGHCINISRGNSNVKSSLNLKRGPHQIKTLENIKSKNISCLSNFENERKAVLPYNKNLLTKNAFSKAPLSINSENVERLLLFK